MNNNIIKNSKWGIIMIILLLASSCNSWLDVTPKGQVDAEGLYTTSKGCNSALGGIYYKLSSSDLYGKNLTYGAMDILAQYWDKNVSGNPNFIYYKLSKFDYTNSTSVTLFNTIWSTMYQAIAGCNALLYYMTPHKDDIANANLILGEAYALRAYCHMELFEMFGPVIHTQADLQKKAIAYRTSFDVVAKTFNTGEEVLNMAEADFKQALELLKDDPIKTVGRRGDYNSSYLDYQDVLNYRGAHMNYFCVLGLLARLEALRLNMDQAYIYADQVIKESKSVISLVNNLKMQTAYDNERDVNFSGEMLGSFYVNNLFDLTYAYFSMEGKGMGANNAITIETEQYKDLINNVYGRTPDGSGTDNRIRYWFTKQTNMAVDGYYNFYKLHSNGLKFYTELPIMRISEAYYIACESQIGKNNKLALEYLNAVRQSRNLTDDIKEPIDDSTLKEYLVREERKDFLGDGRMFLVNKHLFYEIHVTDGKDISPIESMFVFPIPDSEYEYTDNVKETNN